MTASENLRRMAECVDDDGNYEGTDPVLWLKTDERDLMRMLARALDALETDAHDAHLSHSGHEFDACPWQKCRETRAILADADRLFGNDTEKEERAE